MGKKAFDRERFSRHVTHHGFGSPTDQGYALGRKLVVNGARYTQAAAEVVARGMTEQKVNLAPWP